MINLHRLYKIFSDALDIPLSGVVDDLKYNTIPNWDSTAHMLLIAELENEFNVMLEMDEIIDLSSVSKSREILSKHGIKF